MAKDIGGVWRTVGGRRIFIKEGQDLASAMKESGKFNSSSSKKAKNIIDEVNESNREYAKKKAEEYRNTKDPMFQDVKEERARNYEKQASYKASDLEEGKPYEIDMGNGIKKTAIYMGKDSDGNSAFYDGEGVNGTFAFSDKFVNEKLKVSDNKDDEKFMDLHNQLRNKDMTNKLGIEKDNQKWLTEKDSNWLKNQGHDTELEKKIKNFKPSGDIDNDERRLEDISSNYFYDEVGIYNENIDSTATKWAHDKAVELNDKNKLAKEKTLADVYSYTDKQIEEGKNPLFNRATGKDKELLAQIQEETDSMAYKELLGEYNAGKLTSADLEDTLKTLKKFNGDTDDLMTAEQLKGKNREEQKEINKQYLKEQNKLAQEKNDSDFAKEWYEGTKKTENMARENLERAKRNGASVEDLSNRTKQVHELELETQKAQEHANKMSARANSNNLENKYKISKTNDGKEYMRTISPYDETEYAYAEKRNDSWYVKDPTKKTSSGSSQTHIYNDVNEARAKMEEINNRIKGNSENSGKNYEGVTYNNYKKEEVNESSIDHRNEPKTSSDVMNANIRNAYQEYKKKHPGSKINFSKFKDNYKS